MLLAYRENENLGRLSCKITPPLVFAHLRAAYPGMPASEQICHPFQVSENHPPLSQHQHACCSPGGNGGVPWHRLAEHVEQPTDRITQNETSPGDLLTSCNPLQYGRRLFMHSGTVGLFAHVRRALLASLSAEAFDSVQSFHSNSAVASALFLNNLPDPRVQLQPAQILAAMEDRTAYCKLLCHICSSVGGA